MGMILLELCALVAGVAVIGIVFCWLEREDVGQLSNEWRNRINRDERP